MLSERECMLLACAHASESHLDNYVPEKKEKADGAGEDGERELADADDREGQQ